MSKNSYQFPLTLRVDTNKDEFMIGSTDLPMLVDLQKVTFLVFFPEDGSDKGALLIRPRTDSSAPVKDNRGPRVITRPPSRNRSVGDEDT